MSESSRPCLASVSPTVRRLNASNRRQARPTACADHDVCVACAVLLGDPVQGECGPGSSAPMATEPARVSITSTRTIPRHAPMGDGAALAQAAPRHRGLLPCSLVAQEHGPHRPVAVVGTCIQWIGLQFRGRHTPSGQPSNWRGAEPALMRICIAIGHLSTALVSCVSRTRRERRSLRFPAREFNK